MYGCVCVCVGVEGRITCMSHTSKNRLALKSNLQHLQINNKIKTSAVSYLKGPGLQMSSSAHRPEKGVCERAGRGVALSVWNRPPLVFMDKIKLRSVMGFIDGPCILHNLQFALQSHANEGRCWSPPHICVLSCTSSDFFPLVSCMEKWNSACFVGDLGWKKHPLYLFYESTLWLIRLHPLSCLACKLQPNTASCWGTSPCPLISSKGFLLTQAMVASQESSFWLSASDLCLIFTLNKAAEEDSPRPASDGLP